MSTADLFSYLFIIKFLFLFHLPLVFLNFNQRDLRLCVCISYTVKE